MTSKDELHLKADFRKELPVCSPLKLAQHRKRLNLTQTQAARVVRVKPSTWRAWEYGHNPMPEGMWELWLIKASKILNLLKNPKQ